MKLKWKWLLRVLVLVLLYFLLGNARSVQENPFIPGALIAVNMIVPVLAGILFGRGTGLSVGIFGTLLNAVGPAGTIFEFLAIVPNGIMGYAAGYFKVPSPVLAFSIIIGHLLQIFAYVIFAVLPMSALASLNFWYGLIYETFVGVIGVIVIVTIYRMGFEGKWL